MQNKAIEAIKISPGGIILDNLPKEFFLYIIFLVFSIIYVLYYNGAIDFVDVCLDKALPFVTKLALFFLSFFGFQMTKKFTFFILATIFSTCVSKISIIQGAEMTGESIDYKELK